MGFGLTMSYSARFAKEAEDLMFMSEDGIGFAACVAEPLAL
jgi:hypothetical protein